LRSKKHQNGKNSNKDLMLQKLSRQPSSKILTRAFISHFANLATRSGGDWSI